MLAALRADTASLRIAFAAPALGSAVVVIPLFMLSNVGVPLKVGGPPVLLAIVAASAIVLAIRRPRVPRLVIPVAGIALVHMIVVGRPMFRFGFHWLANANGDMGYYVLSATALQNSGLRDPVDRVALVRDHDFSTVAHTLHELGVRVGADVVLSSVAATTGRFAADVYMPLILSVSMVGICASAALAMQFASRARAAIIAAALLAVSPLATYGVVQQLLPQVWGLALGAALFALLMRPELHARSRPPMAELMPVWILGIALFVVYVELAASLSVAYAVYVVFLAVRRRLSAVGVLRLWGLAILGLVLVVNVYLPRAIDFATGSAFAGVSKFGSLNLFANSIVPTALPGVAGFQSLFAPPSERFMSVSIVAAMVVLGVALVAAVVTARRGVAASVVIVGDLILGVLLALELSDFGLFKLYMWVQPFLAAAVAVWITSIRSRVVLGAAAAVTVLVVAAQVRTQASYVSASFNPPDLRHASDADLLPAFRSLLTRAELPVLSVTDNPPLTTLQGAAASAARRPLEFVSSNPFELPSKRQTFGSVTPNGNPVSFTQSRGALELLASNRCEIAMPSGSQHVLNRWQLPEGMPDLVAIDCAKARNLLAFVVSSVGKTFYAKTDVSFWSLERDPSFPGRTMSGFGRYALLQVVNPTPGARLELAFSTSSLRDPSLSFRLPAASVTGSRRIELPVRGSGSARVISPPLRPQMIGGHAYLLLDIGKPSFFPTVPRPGLTGLWGRSKHLDPREVTSHVRDISLVSEREYRNLDAPRALRRFPDDLAKRGLEYSGIYEDGWVGEESYAMLAGGPASRVVVRAELLPRPGQRVQLRIDGRLVASRSVGQRLLDLAVPVPASPNRRRVELKWASTAVLGPKDPRQAAARLLFFGIAEPPVALASFPRALKDPGLVQSGIFEDGWIEKDSYAVLAGGEAANLVVRAQVPPREGGQVVRVVVNGRRVAFRRVPPGSFELRVPITASTKPRRVELHWAGTVRLRPPDTRSAAARLTFLGIAEPPTRVSEFPKALQDPGLVHAGIFDDGWLEQDAQVVLAGGEAANLILQAQVPERAGGQRLRVVVNGRQVASQEVSAGPLELRVPLAASRSRRRIELQWAGTVRLRPPDSRVAAALLQSLRIARRNSPAAISHFPGDLQRPGVAYTGIYRDGWLEKEARVVLASGPSGHLSLRAQIIVPDQRLDLLVDGRKVASQAVEPGQFELRVPIPASESARTIELRWAETARLAGNDPREAAALLQSISVAEAETPESLTIPRDLANPNLTYEGIYKDGWSQKNARVLMAAGAAGNVSLRAQVVITGQRLDVLVNGRTVASRVVSPGTLDLRIPIPGSERARRVELRWSQTATIAENDPRQAAALLQSIAVSAAKAPSELRLPDDLADPDLSTSGIFKDGWSQRNARFLLAGGAAGSLTVRAQVITRDQRLEIRVNGRSALTTAVRPGQLTLRTPIPASPSPRTIELRWRKTARLAPNDPRQGAALLQAIAVTATSSPALPPPVNPILRAALSAGEQVPPLGGTGRGTFTGTVDGLTLRWQLAVSGLSGPVVAAVIRQGARGEIGERLVPLCGPCPSSATGTLTLTTTQRQALLGDDNYVNVGTPANPTGEIRGQLAAP